MWYDLLSINKEVDYNTNCCLFRELLLICERILE